MMKGVGSNRRIKSPEVFSMKLKNNLLTQVRSSREDVVVASRRVPPSRGSLSELGWRLASPLAQVSSRLIFGCQRRQRRK